MLRNITSLSVLKRLFLVSFFSIALSLILAGSARVQAYDQSRLIDDQLFIDTDSMSVSDIQAFLDNDGGFLATWIDQVNVPFPDKYQAGDGNGVNEQCYAHIKTNKTAAQIIHEAANNWQAKYVIWRDTSNNVIPSSQWATTSSSQIKSCRTETANWPSYNLGTVSPKVILATLQKEQGIVTAGGSYSLSEANYNDPCDGGTEYPCYATNNNYKLVWAMGYGYPDSNKLNYRFTGFYSQVNWGAWQLRFNFERSAAVDNSSCGSTNLDSSQNGLCWDDVEYITYSGPMTEGTFVRSDSHSPSLFNGYATIDGQQLYMSNRATASLYYYTPHTCTSGCGNFNFVSFYEQWFGSAIVNHNIRVTTSLSASPSSTTIGQGVTASFVIKNYENYEVTLSAIKVAARAPDGSRVDFPQDSDITIPANSTYIYSKTKAFNDPGTYKFWIASHRDWYGWSFYYPSGTNSSIVKSIEVPVRDANIRTTSSLSASPSSTTVGNDVTASFAIKNYESHPVTLKGIKVAAENDDGIRADFPNHADITIPAKGTYQYSDTQAFEHPGTYKFWIASHRDWYGWSFYYPSGTNSSIVKSIEVTMPDANIRTTTSLSATPSPAGSGQNVTASFAIKNYENHAITLGALKVAVRAPNGSRVDFDPDSDITIPAKSTYTYTKTKAFNDPGTYNLWIASYRDWYGWSFYYPSGTNSSIVKSIDLTVNP